VTRYIEIFIDIIINRKLYEQKSRSRNLVRC